MRKSQSYVCTLDVQSATDMQSLDLLRKAISVINKTSKANKRVVVRGRKPFIKMLAYSMYRQYTGNPVSYDDGGNIVGGIANASILDVYIYDKA